MESYGTKSDGNIRTVTVDDYGHTGVVAHGHSDVSNFQFSKDLSASQDFILVDLSDTANYPHERTGFLHLEHLHIETEGSSTANYVVSVGFVEGVDATNGDFYPVFSVHGNKTAGQSKELVYNPAPNGPVLRSSSVITSGVSLNDTGFQTDTSLASTLTPGSTTVAPNNGDMVMRVTVSAGQVVVSVNGSYHSHSVDGAH